MNNAFRTAEDYELFLYSLPDHFPSIRRSTLTFVRLGASLARIVGELFFDDDIRVVVREMCIRDRPASDHPAGRFSQECLWRVGIRG